MASGRVVAELGRPETPEETAERKARDSRLYRERKTLSNLIYALIATLVAVVVIVVLNPMSPKPIDRTVDAAAVAANASASLGTTALVPGIAGSVNAAEVRTSPDGVKYWYVGTITGDNEYIGMLQAVDANASWVSNQLANTAPSGAVEIAGQNWLVYNNRDNADKVGNAAYALTTEFTAADGTHQTIVLLGTASDAEFTAAATAAAAAIAKVS